MDKLKKLREISGVSLALCKKALQEANDDLQKALEILKKSSAEVAARKSLRETKDGTIVIKKAGEKTAVVVLNSETDFVAKNENFLKLAEELADLALKEGKEKAKAEAAEKIPLVIQKTGENIQLKEIDMLTGPVATYVHNGKIGAAVKLLKENPKLAFDLAMQVTALAPTYLSWEDIPKDKWQTMQNKFEEETKQMNKPENIQKKIVEGKLKEYFRPTVLLAQAFIKDDKITVEELLKKENNSISFFRLYTL